MWVESEEEKKEVKEKKKTIEILTSWKNTKTDDHFFAVVFASQQYGSASMQNNL